VAVRIERWYAERDGALSEVAIQRKIESLGFTVTSRLYPAGNVDWPCDETRVCVSAVVRGLVKLMVDGEPVYLAPGDIAFIPAGAQRSLEVVGSSVPLCLEAVPRSD
jgi:mannose-6-phosphate isomerase-like protein (cupin superfamily)